MVMTTPLSNASFTLNVSGVAGFFGGDEAVSAMATLYTSRRRKWLGWYNSPGSYVVAKKYGQLAHSKFWRGIFPRVEEEPTTLFGLHGMQGPEYLAAHSKAHIKTTGHIGYLVMKECEDRRANRVGGRFTIPAEVTLINLNMRDTPDAPFLLRPPAGYAISALSLIPILVSVSSCVLCGLFGDWYCCSMILLGILATQLSYSTIGSGTIHFMRPRTQRNAPSAHGILKYDRQTAIVFGSESAVTAITRGRFWVRLPGEPHCSSIGYASLLLIAQFLLQLLLIPQGTLFGQILFLGTFAVSWVYNALCLSADNEIAQREILMKQVLQNPPVIKYRFGTPSAMATFVLLVLKPNNPLEMLNELLPVDTKVFRAWKEAVIQGLEQNAFPLDRDICGEPLSEAEITELRTLLKDSNNALVAYEKNSKEFDLAGWGGRQEKDIAP